RELRQKAGAKQPEPGNAQNGTKNDRMLAYLPEDGVRFKQKVIVDFQTGIRRLCWRYRKAGEQTQRSHRDDDDGNNQRTTLGHDQQATANRTQQNGNKSAAVDQRIAAD